MCLFKCITGFVSEHPLAVNVLKQNFDVSEKIRKAVIQEGEILSFFAT